MLQTECIGTQAGRSAEDVRAWIVGELSRSLNVEPCSIDTAAPLVTLGVNSLAAIGMTGGLASWLGRDLPATLMWDYPSIDAIAEGLAESDAPAETAHPGIYDLQPQGDRRPLFCLPAVDGHPITFAALAAHLGPTQPCYGLVTPGFNGEREPLTRVEDIAAVMLQSIRQVQPKGPYQLVGYSFGGLLAYEIAQQLTAVGESVSMLAIYDTYTPAGRTKRPRWQRLGLHAYLMATQPGLFQYLRTHFKNRRRTLEVEKIVNEVDAANNFVYTPKSRDMNIGLVNSRAANSYRPRPYAGSLLLLRAAERDRYNVFYRVEETNGWSALVGGGVRVIDVPGTHWNLINAANAGTAAEALRPHLSDETLV